MTLSTSRQQFLAYETHATDDIKYGRRGGIFLSTCVCAAFVALAIVLAALVGVIVYFFTLYKLTENSGDFWDDSEPFSQSLPLDLSLPNDVVPSFYRLKIKADLENSLFSGNVYITIRASGKAKGIILHSQNLNITGHPKLTEQIIEKVETLHLRRRREAELNNTIEANVTSNEQNITSNLNTSAPDVTENTVEPEQNTIHNDSKDIDNVTSSSTTINTPTVKIPTETPTQVIHSNTKDIQIIAVTKLIGDRLVLTLATALKPDVDYILELPFSGVISDSLTGFYKSTYTNANKEKKLLAATQFEPISARAAFPCFDEPIFKAKFEISIAHRNNLTVLSNMKIVTTEDLENEPGWVWTHFERSVNMSTYLVAYVICDFKSLDTSYISKDNVTKPIRIWARPELINKAHYAVSITPKLLKYYEEVFGQPYALDKLDMIAIPDFSSGAMENWGLITFTETGLLLDEENGTPRDKQNVAIDIAHELAHQWFGNLVTMCWWNDLWLNEGFATYIEYVGVNYIEPEWAMFDSFTRDKLDLLRSDALKNTSPVSREVAANSEIAQKFDEISYLKGANLIRMLNHTISEEFFHKGLVDYLNRWKFSNAEENDLWESMSIVAAADPVLKGHPLTSFMNSWTRQPGYPVVDVRRDYTTGKVTWTQNLFTSSKKPYQEMVDQIWEIPISYTSVDAPEQDWSSKPKLWLTERSMTTEIPINSTQALYVNIGATGYYRVNYDQTNWERLSKALKSGHIQSPITKAQLIDDAFNLAKANLLNYSYALDLATCVKDGEDSRMVWDLLLNNMGFIRHILKPTSGYTYFQDFMKIILREQLKRVNYGLGPLKDDNQLMMVEGLVTWECVVETPRCLQWARTQFDAWVEHPHNNTIPPYLRSLVYNVALRHGGRTEFDFLWNMFQNSTDPAVKTLIINSLPSTREESLIAMLLEKSLSDIPKQYAQSVWSVEAPVGTRIAQQFLIDNFDRVYTTFTDLDSFKFPMVLSGAFGTINYQEELDKLKSFALSHKQQLMPLSQTIQKLVDTASLRLNWMRAHTASVSRWFQKYVADYAAQRRTVVTKPSEPVEAKKTDQPTSNATIIPETTQTNQRNDTIESQPDLNTTQTTNDTNIESTQ